MCLRERKIASLKEKRNKETNVILLVFNVQISWYLMFKLVMG